MSRKWLLSAVALVLVAAVGIALVLRQRKPEPKPVATAVADAPAAEVNFVGTVQPRTIVAVGAPSIGVLDAFFVDAGQEVYKDQLLGRLRDASLDQGQKSAQAQLDQAQGSLAGVNSELLAAKLELSRATADQVRAHGDIDRFEKEYERQKKFWDQGITPRLTYEKAQKDYEAAKAGAAQQDAAVARAKDRMTELNGLLEAANAQIAQASEMLEKAKDQSAAGELHSPADGLVVARQGQPGDKVDPSAGDLFKIATDLTQLEVDASPDPEIVGRIHAGQAVSVRVPELSPDEIAGVVREVRGPQVIIDFTSPTPLAKLELAAQVRIKF